MAFTDSYKHMECLGGMRLQGFFLLCLPVQRRVPQLVHNIRRNSKAQFGRWIGLNIFYFITH